MSSLLTLNGVTLRASEKMGRPWELTLILNDKPEAAAIQRTMRVWIGLDKLDGSDAEEWKFRTAADITRKQAIELADALLMAVAEQRDHELDIESKQA